MQVVRCVRVAKRDNAGELEAPCFKRFPGGRLHAQEGSRHLCVPLGAYLLIPERSGKVKRIIEAIVRQLHLPGFWLPWRRIVSGGVAMQFTLEKFFEMIEGRFGKHSLTVLLAAVYLAIFGTALALVNDHILAPIVGYFGRVYPFINKHHLELSWFVGVVSFLVAFLLVSYAADQFSAVRVSAERIRERDQEIASLKKQAEQREAENKRLQVAVDSRQATAHSILEDNNKLRNRIQEQEQLISVLKAGVAVRESAEEKLKASLDNLVSEKDKTIQKLTSDLSDRDRKYAALEGRAEGVAQELQRKTTQVRQLEHQNEQLAQQLERTRLDREAVRKMRAEGNALVREGTALIDRVANARHKTIPTRTQEVEDWARRVCNLANQPPLICGAQIIQGLRLETGDWDPQQHMIGTMIRHAEPETERQRLLSMIGLVSSRLLDCLSRLPLV